MIKCYFWSLWHTIHILCTYKVKHSLQRVTRGYSDNEIWNLNDAIIDYALPRLKVFRKDKVMSHPTQFKSLQEWHDVLDEIIFCFEHREDVEQFFTKGIDANIFDIKEYKKFRKRINAGFTSFGRHLQNLSD